MFNIPMLTYYLTAVGCGLVVGIYAVVIYLLILQKNERYFRE
jgi:biopolymer transport protein ExbB/TolQ